MIDSKKIICVSLISLVLCSSCQQSLNRSEYLEWVQDYRNGLHVKKNHSEFIFDIQYQPSEYVAVLNNEAALTVNDALEYFTLRISMTDPAIDVVSYDAYNHDDKQERLYYFSYLFQHDLYLEQDGNKMPCILFHAEPSSLKKVRTFVLGFERIESGMSPEVTFVVNSPKFSALPLKIKLTKADIPTVKI